ncbi:MAG: cupin domain-containing protein [Hyphomicrobium sp.]
MPGRRSTTYPAEYAAPFDKRIKRALGDAGGLTQFGVNLTTLEPGAISALRHWHANEDEFVYVLDGELTLITNAGEQLLGVGMAATFPAGEPDAHQLVNRSRRFGDVSGSRDPRQGRRNLLPPTRTCGSSSATAVAASCASPASPTNEPPRHNSQGSDPPLPLDLEALRRLELPPHADLL